jgi:hypothetical protein
MGRRLVTRSTVQLGEKVLGWMPESAPLPSRCPAAPRRSVRTRTGSSNGWERAAEGIYRRRREGVNRPPGLGEGAAVRVDVSR